jgi:uncharacterized protein YkwD
MRALAALASVSALVLGSTATALAIPRTPSGPHPGGYVQAARTPLERFTSQLLKTERLLSLESRPQGTSAHKVVLSSLEADIVTRMNAQRTIRGLRPLRVSIGLTAAANYHCRQMGLFGFFEHESRNGTPFWRRIERFYHSGRYRYWSVGENILYQSPQASGPSAVHDWMVSPPHRENILSREYREVGVAAVHFNSAPGAYGGHPVTIVTADFGARY